MTIPRQDAYRFTAAATCSRKKVEEITINLTDAGLTRPAAQRLVEEMVCIRQERGAAGAPVPEEELLKAGSGQGTPLAFVADPRPRRRRPLDLHVKVFVGVVAALSLAALSFLGITLPLWVEAIIAATVGSLAGPLFEAVRPRTGSEIAEAKQQDRAMAFLEHLGEKRPPQGPPKGSAPEQRLAQQGETSFDWKDLSG